MGKGEPDQAVDLGLAGGVGAGLGLILDPVVRPVPVQVDAAGRVLVDRAVAVVVDALGRLGIDRLLPLGEVGPAEEPGFLVVGHERGLGVLEPHREGQAVAVEVVGAILVLLAVAVAVDRREVGPEVEPGRPSEQPLGAVGVEPGDDVDRPPTELAPDPCHPPRQPFDQAEGDLRAHQVVGLQVGDDQDRGPRRCRFPRETDRREPDVAPFPRLRQRLDPDRLRVGRRGSPEGVGEPLVIEISAREDRWGVRLLRRPLVLGPDPRGAHEAGGDDQDDGERTLHAKLGFRWGGGVGGPGATAVPGSPIRVYPTRLIPGRGARSARRGTSAVPLRPLPLDPPGGPEERDQLVAGRSAPSCRSGGPCAGRRASPSIASSRRTRRPSRRPPPARASLRPRPGTRRSARSRWRRRSSSNAAAEGFEVRRGRLGGTPRRRSDDGPATHRRPGRRASHGPRPHSGRRPGRSRPRSPR